MSLLLVLLSLLALNHVGLSLIGGLTMLKDGKVSWKDVPFLITLAYLFMLLTVLLLKGNFQIYS